MNIAHLADLHLGFSAYDRTERGRNVRERDVAVAFQHAVERLVELSPEVILIAGDIFDRPDPAPAALVALTRGLDSLSSALPDVPILMVAGARDTPRRPGDQGALAALDSFPRVEAVTSKARHVSLLGGSLHVAMVPYRAVLEEPHPALEPDPDAGVNLLLAYARHDPRASLGLRVERRAWDYVALGYDHAVRQVAPNVHYAGSLERVGPTPWREAAVEKGFLTFDTKSSRSTFHAIPGRPVVDLAPIRVPGGDPTALAERLREVTDEVPGGIDGKIVHLTLRGIKASELLGIQGDLLASLRARALHLSLDVDEALGRGGRSRSDVRERLHAELEGTGFGTLKHISLMDELLDGGNLEVGQ